MRLAWLASHNDKISEISLYALISNTTGLHVQHFQSWIVNKRLPFLGMNILKISFQYSTYTAKETLFRSEIMRYNDLEQTNTLVLRENRNQNASNFANVFAYMSPESITTHGCSRIIILISVILNSLLRILSHVFYSSHSSYYVRLCSSLKLKTLLSDLEA